MPLAERDGHYFGEIYDHLIRISDLIDSYRDLLISAMDVSLSTVSSRLNGVMKQLAVIAMMFFAAELVDWVRPALRLAQRADRTLASVRGCRVGSELVALAILLGLFERSGWF